jgi:tRNA nucleotidyltransferase/poly(A) polymerase
MSTSILKHFKSHPAWADAEEILSRLAEAGYSAVLAGGCVRDAVLCRPIGDFDIATDARPDAIEGLFPKTVAVGKVFGIIKVIGRISAIDVATFRVDGPYEDGRHPSTIEFADLEGDARRRDFTINALFYRWNDHQVLDVAGGMADLRARRIRTVGPARERFNEDSLRPLRAVRFVAQLDFAIEPMTWSAIVELAPATKRVAKERQLEELRKLSSAGYSAKGWDLLRSSMLLKAILPELGELCDAQIQSWHAALRALLASRSGWPLPITLGWFATIFGVKDVGSWLDSLKSSTDERRTAEGVVAGLMKLCSSETTLAHRLRLLDNDEGVWLVKLWPLARLHFQSIPISVVDDTVSRFQKLMQTDGHLPGPWLNGDDLLAMGLKPGAELGRCLERAYDLQITGAAREKADLVERIRAQIEQH